MKTQPTRPFAYPIPTSSTPQTHYTTRGTDRQAFKHNTWRFMSQSTCLTSRHGTKRVNEIILTIFDSASEPRGRSQLGKAIWLSPSERQNWCKILDVSLRTLFYFNAKPSPSWKKKKKCRHLCIFSFYCLSLTRVSLTSATRNSHNFID